MNSAWVGAKVLKQWVLIQCFHCSMDMMVTVGASTWAVSSLPVSFLALAKIRGAMAFKVRGS